MPQRRSSVLDAAFGTALLTVVLTLIALVPLLAAIVGGTAVFLTGFGRRVFVPASEHEEAGTAAR